MKQREEFISRIIVLFEDSNYEDLKEVMINMAINSPDICFEVLAAVGGGSYSFKNPFTEDYSTEEALKIERKKLEEFFFYARNKEVDGVNYCPSYTGIETAQNEYDIEQFVKKCILARENSEVRKEIDTTIRERFGENSIRALRYFLSKSDDDTIRDFAYACLPPENLAANATVDIVVSKTANNNDIRGNTGSFLIHTQKDGGVPYRLKFTHQASCVYYLMHLIDRCNGQHGTESLSLQKNKTSFMELYHKVYDIRQADLNERFENLLFREDKHGEIRAGRLKEIIYDIKKQMNKAFNQYDESCFPYIMTAEKHISVSIHRIHFVGEAEELLNFKFR